jgi:hypothetical protein
MPCAECARLEAEKRAAYAAGDISKVVDCRVLLSRHPGHRRFVALRKQQQP